MNKNRRKCLKFIGQVTLFSSLIPSIFISCEESTMTTDWHGELNGTEKRLKKALKKILRERGNIFLKWECGGDQAIISIEGNTDVLDNLSKSVKQDFQIYIMNFLNLPDVGEFSLEGKGKLYMQNEDIYIECESLMTINKHELLYKPDDLIQREDTTFVDTDYSGTKKLFEKNKN